MNKQLQSIKNIALNKTWVSFLNNNHPYTLLHWSIGGIHEEKKDVWLIQDEVTFESDEFENIDLAIEWIKVNMNDITDVMG